MTKFSYELFNKDGRARRGKITTPHGEIQTPIFMPVGTRGTVKTITQEHIANVNAQIILETPIIFIFAPGMN